MRKNRYIKVLSAYLSVFILIVIAFFVFNVFFSSDKKVEPLTYSDLIQAMDSGMIESLEINRDLDVSDSGVVKFKLNDRYKMSGKNYDLDYGILQIPSMSSFMKIANQDSVIWGFKIKTNFIPKTGFLIQLLSPILMLFFSILLLFFFMNKMQGGNGSKILSFGASKAKSVQSDKNKVTFNDVAGLDEEKVELQEIVEFLKMPTKFTIIGARIPKGVLLVGPPGTGKTLLAKAVAGEAGVPFFSMSGSDFVEMFVGVGASRVRDLFEQAKKNLPCIIFIDEIDAVGRKRGAGLGGGHDEREQTLNQLLVEMDGFGVNQGVIVVAATNRPDILDPALLRPGRFDRRVVVGRPDVKGREEILKVHAKGKLLSNDVDLKVIAQTTSGFTGADLENLLNEAALLTARVDKNAITMNEIRRAFIKVGIGTEKKSRVISDEEKIITAYHEAGHAILFEILSELDPVHMISIIPTGMAGGYTMNIPVEERNYVTKKKMEQNIISLLGGRAAEELMIKDITTGASNDIERATAIARDMVMRYGMSDKFGPIHFGDGGEELFLGRDFGRQKNYSEETACMIDDEIKEIIRVSYAQALEIIKSHMNILIKTADLLMQKEKITGDEFRALFDNNDNDEE